MTESIIKTDKSQIGVIGSHVTIEGGIHFHQSPSAAASEKWKDSRNTVTRCKPVRVFISYAREDIDTARKLYDDLKKAGMNPWLDEEDLLPGLKWKEAITGEIKTCRFFIALLSSNSVVKKGFVQTELKKALDILGDFPDKDIFLIPVRIDDCEIPEKLAELHCTAFFPSYERGLEKVLRVFKVIESEKTDSTMKTEAADLHQSQESVKEAVIASVLEPEKEFTNSIGMKFVYIRPGTFMMGSPEDEPGRSSDEILHKVTLTKGFYMQTTQVTVGHWRAFVNADGFKTEVETGDGAYGWTGSKWKKDKKYYWDKPGFPQTDEHPVTCVSWNDAQAFMAWLNEKEKQFYRLPTEAEWEYSCRAGTATPVFFGKCLSTDEANYDGNYPLKGCPKGKYREKTVPVGSFAPNAWGLYDMHGNVWEWCQDSCDYKDGKIITDTYKDGISDPVCNKGPYRVARGGGWFGDARRCRSASRNSAPPGHRDISLGFRVQRS